MSLYQDIYFDICEHITICSFVDEISKETKITNFSISVKFGLSKKSFNYVSSPTVFFLTTLSIVFRILSDILKTVTHVGLFPENKIQFP